MPSNELEEGRLACSISAHETDALPRIDKEGDVFKKICAPKGQTNLVYAQHLGDKSNIPSDRVGLPLTRTLRRSDIFFLRSARGLKINALCLEKAQNYIQFLRRNVQNVMKEIFF